MITFSPSHTWLVTVWSGRECLIVSYGKLQKIMGRSRPASPPNSSVGKVWGFPKLSNNQTCTSDEV